MKANRPPYQLHLITLSLWQEVLDGDEWEWRGEAKNTRTGELRYFRDWCALVHLLPKLLSEPIKYQSQDEPDTID